MADRKPPSGLERLLDVRRIAEERRTVELVRARQVLEEADDAMRSLVDRREAIETSMHSPNRESVGRVQSLRVVLERIEQGIKNARTVHTAARRDAEERSEAFQEAARDRQVLERVVDAREESARQTSRIAEQKLQDEAALVRFRSKDREGP